MDRVVVVGASLAGLRAAEAVREHGHAGELIVVGAEAHPPYTRPPLSKQLLAGAWERERVDLRWEEVEADWRLGVEATGLDPGARVVHLAGGEELRYDGLVVATGARPRPWPHAVPDGVFMLREVDDALALRRALTDGGRLVIVGAGFIGCEVAATARSLGVEVVLCDIAATPMAVLGPELGAACAALQLDHGVELVMGRSIEALEADGDGRLAGVRLGDGSHIDAEVAVVALGAIPNVEWLQDSGLDVSRGLVCDVACAAVGRPEIAGAGDVAAWPHPLADGELVRVEHWSNAAEQGSVAGANLVRAVDERVPYDAVPSFWSDQYDVKVQSVGFATRAERVRVLEGSIAERKFVAAGERDGRLIAAVGFNAARRMPFYRRLIGERAAFDDVVSAVAADERALPVAG